MAVVSTNCGNSDRGFSKHNGSFSRPLPSNEGHQCNSRRTASCTNLCRRRSSSLSALFGSSGGSSPHQAPRFDPRKSEGFIARSLVGTRSPNPPGSGRGSSESLGHLLIPSSSSVTRCGSFCEWRQRVDGLTYRAYRAEDLIVGELIGKGFFGEVYRVFDKVTLETIVLKKLRPLSDLRVEQRFLKEVSVLRKLDHPHVLKYVGVLYQEKQIHLLTEFVPGGTLKQLIEDSNLDLPWARRVSLAQDIASGMSYLHSVGIIHRDLNPGNILIRERQTGPAVVADFGLVQLAGAKKFRRCTLSIVGSAYWMAPEMLREGVYDERVDMFSFGIILCELIGRVSADPDLVPRTLDFGLDRPRFLSLYCQTCPPPLYQLAFRCAHVSPDQRPAFSVVWDWLSQLLGSLERAEAVLEADGKSDTDCGLAMTVTPLPSRVESSCGSLSSSILSHIPPPRSPPPTSVTNGHRPSDVINNSESSSPLSLASPPCSPPPVMLKTPLMRKFVTTLSDTEACDSSPNRDGSCVQNGGPGLAKSLIKATRSGSLNYSTGGESSVNL